MIQHKGRCNMKRNRITRNSLSIALFVFAIGIALAASGPAWAKPKSAATGPDPTTVIPCTASTTTLSANNTVYVVSSFTTTFTGTCIKLIGNNDLLTFSAGGSTVQGPGATSSSGAGIDIEGTNDVINGRASNVTGFAIGILDNGSNTLGDNIDVGCFAGSCATADGNGIGLEMTGGTVRWNNVGSAYNTGDGIFFNGCGDECGISDFFTADNGGDGLAVRNSGDGMAAVFISIDNTGNGVHLGGTRDKTGNSEFTVADASTSSTLGVYNNGSDGVFLDTSEKNAADVVTGIDAESNGGIDLHDATATCGSQGHCNLWVSLIVGAGGTTQAGTATSPACIPLLPNL